MKPEIKFYIILTIDIEKNSRYFIKNYKPNIVKYPKFYVTEKKVEETEYYKIHRKYCGILNIDELSTFVDDCNFDGTEKTMGSLTFEYGHLPAISFDCYGHDYRVNAYISPIFSDETENKLNQVAENCRENVKEQIETLYDEMLNALKNYLDDENDLNKVIDNAELEINQPLLF